MGARRHLSVRFSDDGVARLDDIADEHFDGMRSVAVRRVFALGLAAWDAGFRLPKEVNRATDAEKIAGLPAEVRAEIPDAPIVDMTGDSPVRVLPSASEAKAARRARMLGEDK